MRRRQILTGTAAIVGTGLSRPGLSRAKGVRTLTMTTDWPEGPGMLSSAERLATSIRDASDGRLLIEVFPSGALVRPFETFDATQAGLVDMFHSHFGYFASKSPAFEFFSGVPFGLTPGELLAWLRFGDAQALWDELGARFDIKPLLCCSTGAQMGGWFVEEIRSIETFSKLRYRMAGLGGEVYRQLGAAVVLLSAGDIVQALRSGAIDACEWAGPWLDTEMGLHRAAAHYYYPGWHEPTGAVSLGVNRKVWDGLDEHDRQLIEIACASEYALSLAEFDAKNAAALRALREDDAISIRRFDDAMLATFAEIGADLVADAGSGDELARRIHVSHDRFLSSIRGWSDVGKGAYLSARASLGR